MKRILLLVPVALMLAAAMALSGVAQAKPITIGDTGKKCFLEAVRTVEHPGFKPSDYTFIGGTEGIDNTFQTTAGPDVLCGFGGNDSIVSIDAGDIFLGGPGDDEVQFNSGTFYGGEGNDKVFFNTLGGTFNGGEGNDFVQINDGTFNGGPGDDTVDVNTGTFVQD
jgi:Ca2+-binding RTX toxin-like protein